MDDDFARKDAVFPVQQGDAGVSGPEVRADAKFGLAVFCGVHFFVRGKEGASALVRAHGPDAPEKSRANRASHRPQWTGCFRGKERLRGFPRDTFLYSCPGLYHIPAAG